MSKRLLSLIMAGGVMILPFGTVIDGKTIQFKRPGTLVDSQDLDNGLSLIGSTIKAQSFGLNTALLSSDMPLASGDVFFVAVNIPATMTANGVMFLLTTQGNFTPGPYTGVGLYSFSGGTITLLASSTNNGGLFTGVAGVPYSQPFATPVVIQPGVYCVAFLATWSAAVVVPRIISGASTFGVVAATLDLPNSGKTYGILTGQTAFPSSQAMSGITPTVVRPWVALY